MRSSNSRSLDGTSNLKYSTPPKNAQQAAIATLAGANPVLTLYSGAQPASLDIAVTSQVALSQHICAVTFDTERNGVLTVGAVGNGTGTAGAGSGASANWYRLTTVAGVALVDGTVGVSGCDLNLVNTNIAQNQPVQISSWTLANGN